jgi:hypothetical protein
VAIYLANLASGLAAPVLPMSAPALAGVVET